MIYEYRAYAQRVVDGDTIVVDIDLGFGIEFKQQTFRLARIDAYETRLGKNTRQLQKTIGLKGKAWLKAEIEGQWIVINTSKDEKGKYGRYLAEITFKGTNMNDAMVDLGFAIYKEY